MKISNSNRIAILFSFFTFFISLCFLTIFAFLYFKSWYEEEQDEVNKIYLWYSIYSDIFNEALIWSKNEIQDNEDYIKKNKDKEKYEKIFLNLYEKEDEYYIVKYINKEESIKYDVTIFMKNQLMQFKVWMFLIIIFTLIAFILSKIIFTKIILKELYLLSNKLEKLNISKWENIENNFYDNDIKTIVNKINTLLKTIYNNQKDLKYFNSQVSHEFKTPLMIINSELEFLELSWLNNKSLQKIQIQIDKLDYLLNSFILLTKIDTANIKKTNINLKNLIDNILNEFNTIYKNKNIKLDINLEQESLNTNKEIFYILLKNLLENAFKYNKDKWNISITFNWNYINIENTVKNINSINLENIFQMFYRDSNDSNWFGIWLSIVKKIIEALWYRIKTKLNKTKETINFSIYLKDENNEN